MKTVERARLKIRDINSCLNSDSYFSKRNSNAGE